MNIICNFYVRNVLIVLSGRAQAIKYLLVDNDIDYEWINTILPDRSAWANKYKPMMVGNYFILQSLYVHV